MKVTGQCHCGAISYEAEVDAILDAKPGVRVLKSGAMQARDQPYRVASLQSCIACRGAFLVSGAGVEQQLQLPALLAASRPISDGRSSTHNSRSVFSKGDVQRITLTADRAGERESRDPYGTIHH